MWIDVDLGVIEDTQEQLSRCFQNLERLAVMQTKYLNICWKFSVFLNMKTFDLGKDIIQKSRGKH